MTKISTSFKSRRVWRMRKITNIFILKANSSRHTAELEIHYGINILQVYFYFFNVEIRCFREKHLNIILYPIRSIDQSEEIKNKT